MTASHTGGKLQGRVAVVTGASRLQGIGTAICRRLAAEGADIFFTYWTNYDREFPWGIEDDEPQRLQEELRGLGVRCERLEADLSQPETAAAILDEVQERFGTVPHILVNNATHSESDGFEALDADMLDKHYRVNVRATTLLSVEFARRFELGTGGRIINLSSGQSLGPMTGELAYAITKGAVEMLTQQLSSAIGHKGITVNAVNPGPTDSGWIDDDLRQTLQPLFPFGRIGEPRDAARLIAFLASDDAEWITGQIIHSEGGFRRG
jgi:3-oxoacyl-[acyl-carrier protein] reductase